MALVKGTNSYATVAEADAYFADRMDVAAWELANEVEKAKSLVTATTLLDNIDWRGVAYSPQQSLAFPRRISFFDPKVGANVSFDSEVPPRLTKAVFEMAYHLLNNDGLLDDTSTVVDVKVGPVTLNKIRVPPTIPGVVVPIIAPMRIPNGLVWWRAN